jgi:hypothetical protein
MDVLVDDPSGEEEFTRNPDTHPPLPPLPYDKWLRQRFWLHLAMSVFVSALVTLGLSRFVFLEQSYERCVAETFDAELAERSEEARDASFIRWDDRADVVATVESLARQEEAFPMIDVEPLGVREAAQAALDRCR